MIDLPFASTLDSVVEEGAANKADLMNTSIGAAGLKEERDFETGNSTNRKKRKMEMGKREIAKTTRYRIQKQNNLAGAINKK